MQNPIRTHIATLLSVDENLIEQNDEQLDDILRRRLTKKERKLLKADAEDTLTPELVAKIAEDPERLDAIRTALEKKLHHPKLRNELVTRGSDG